MQIRERFFDVVPVFANTVRVANTGLTNVYTCYILLTDDVCNYLNGCKSNLCPEVSVETNVADLPNDKHHSAIE